MRTLRLYSMHADTSHAPLITQASTSHAGNLQGSKGHLQTRGHLAGSHAARRRLQQQRRATLRHEAPPRLAAAPSGLQTDGRACLAAGVQRCRAATIRRASGPRTTRWMVCAAAS